MAYTFSPPPGAKIHGATCCKALPGLGDSRDGLVGQFGREAAAGLANYAPLGEALQASLAREAHALRGVTNGAASTALREMTESLRGLIGVAGVGASLSQVSRTWRGVDIALDGLAAYQQSQLALIQGGLREALNLSDLVAPAVQPVAGHQAVGFMARDMRRWLGSVSGAAIYDAPADDAFQDLYFRALTAALPSGLGLAGGESWFVDTPTGVRARITLHGIARQMAEVAQLRALANDVRHALVSAQRCVDPDHELRLRVTRLEEEFWRILSLLSVMGCELMMLADVVLDLLHLSQCRRQDSWHAHPPMRSIDRPRAPPRKELLLAVSQGASIGGDRR